MGKASSSKKVARAARAGGATQSRRHRWMFPAAIIAIFVLGATTVFVAKSSNEKAAAASPAIGEHWHAAYGIYVCDHFLEPLTDVTQDKLGIHTHDDGIMHIHPFSGGAAGNNATFSVFGQTTGLTFQSNGFTTADGTEYHNGYDCNGQPAKVSVYQWSADDLAAAPKIYTKDFGAIHFSEDRLVFTMAVVPEGTDVPQPTSVPTLDNLTDVAGSTPSTSIVGTVSTTVPADASSTSSTAAPPQ